jgi:hypothetical protein
MEKMRVNVSHVNIAAWGLLLVLAGATSLQPAHAASWQPTGKMTAKREQPRVTLLADGTVLITGGWTPRGNDFVPTETAERFDPKTNQFALVGSMVTKHADHAIARLQDGRVLVVGGDDEDAILDSAELFDPATARFTGVGKLQTGRSALTATLLPNGQVLVVGGFSENPMGPQATAELFDPTTGTFQQTGRMTVARYRHTAVALPDGRVAILGGWAPGNRALSRVEIYDPTTGLFSPQGDLVQPRAFMTATLLPDGKIAVVGGYYSDPSGKRIGPRDSVEIYDPATGQSKITDTLAAPLAEHVAIPLADGRVLVTGGVHKSQLSSEEDIGRDAWLLDPTSGKLSSADSMSLRRAGPGAVLLPDGRALVLGGYTGPDDTDTAEAYVP